MDIDALGTRICILGPSNSGKSTLAGVIARTSDLRVVHLDQLRHEPGSQWKLRPDDEFRDLHDKAISGDRWVIDGNYSTLLPERLARATGFVLLESSTAVSLVRYIRRTWSRRERVGGLEGTKDRLHWNMFQYIVGTGRSNRRRYRQLFDEVTLPKILLRSRAEIDAFVG